MFTGKKTKIASIGLSISGVLYFIPSLNYYALGIAMFSLALGFYGMYDRTNRVEDKNNENISELKKRIKKPILRSG